MRLLLFSSTSFDKKGYNGAGWVSSLIKIISNHKEINIGVVYMSDTDSKVSNYDIEFYETKGGIERYLKIIENFKPDIIQIFGSENDYGLICGHTDIPIVIHIQGSLPPYYNALFPIDTNKYDFIFSRGLSLKERYIGLRSKPSFLKRAKREIEIIKQCKYFMGRTDWDYRLIRLFNPSAKYYHCEEALRDSFFESNKKWKWQERTHIDIMTTISSPWYKGMDLVLKTAKLLTKFTNLNFTWHVYGINRVSFYEHKYGIKCEDVNIKIEGIATQQQLSDALCNASCYVHPSYIDNSPNSVCEAQLIGVPVLATFVGGIPSLLKDGAGILFPANDPFTLAEEIKEIVNSKEISEKLSYKEIQLARSRNSKENIENQVISIYKEILNQK